MQIELRSATVNSINRQENSYTAERTRYEWTRRCVLFLVLVLFLSTYGVFSNFAQKNPMVPASWRGSKR